MGKVLRTCGETRGGMLLELVRPWSQNMCIGARTEVARDWACAPAGPRHPLEAGSCTLVAMLRCCAASSKGPSAGQVAKAVSTRMRHIAQSRLPDRGIAVAAAVACACACAVTWPKVAEVALCVWGDVGWLLLELRLLTITWCSASAAGSLLVLA